MNSQEIYLFFLMLIIGLAIGIGFERHRSAKKIALLRESIKTAQVDVTAEQMPVGIYIPLAHLASMPQTPFNELMDWLPPAMVRRILNGGTFPPEVDKARLET